MNLQNLYREFTIIVGNYFVVNCFANAGLDSAEHGGAVSSLDERATACIRAFG